MDVGKGVPKIWERLGAPPPGLEVVADQPETRSHTCHHAENFGQMYGRSLGRESQKWAGWARPFEMGAWMTC